VPKVVDGAAQRAEIREAARRAFGARGVAGTGLAHVADEAGMGRSSLYHYYPDKQSLVRDLIQDLLRDEEALFAAVRDSSGSALERIEQLARALPAVFREWSQLGTMIFDLWSRDAARFRPSFRQMRSNLATVIREGQRDGEIDASLDAMLTAGVVIGAIDGLLLQHLIDPKAFTSVDAIAEAVAMLFRRALR